jgi:RNA polymerase sigma-70 factor, ECF subfamily
MRDFFPRKPPKHTVDFPFNMPAPFPVSLNARPIILLGLGGNVPVDRQTFDRLVLEHLPAAQRLAVRLTGRLDLAEDVVQNALVKASRSWQTFRGESAFRTWLLQIVVHAFRDDWDRRKRRKTDALPDEPTDPHANDPADLVAVSELGPAVAAAVSNLPPRQREVLVLHTYEQMNDAQIAQVLGIAPQNVRTTLHLARQKLKEVLRPYLNESDNARRTPKT